jgi:hypothetical protein
MSKADLAGKFMRLQQSDLFQEGVEGVMAGGAAGLSLIGSDTPASQIAIQTLGGIAGGIGLGLLGKNIGAAIGKRLHPQALKDQSGLLASFGRLAGQKTLASGGTETLRYGKGQIKQELKKQTSAQLLNEALQNPQAFANKYGVDAETFKKYQTFVGAAGQGRAGLEMLENLSPAQRQQMGEGLQNLMNQGFNQVENLINVQAAANMDNNIAKMAMLQKGKTVPGLEMDMGEAFEKLLQGPKNVTGENVGRAVGRFAGDEIGVITGMGLGGLLSNTLGIKTEKDKKIEELEGLLSSSY